MVDLVPAAMDVRADAPRGPVRERVQLLPAGGDHGTWIGHDRPRPQGDQQATFGVYPRREGTPYALARLLDRGPLLCDVGDNPFGRVGRGRGAKVGDEVQQGSVDVVADGTDHRSDGSSHSSDQGFVAEREQVLE